MTVDVRHTETLSERVAEEVRAMLGRRRMSGRELARRLNVSPNWVSLRLTGVQPIDLNDLQRIAEALDVGVHALIPGAVSAIKPSHTLVRRSGSQMARNVRPSDRRPIGRPAALTGPSGQRRPTVLA